MPPLGRTAAEKKNIDDGGALRLGLAVRRRPASLRRLRHFSVASATKTAGPLLLSLFLLLFAVVVEGAARQRRRGAGGAAAARTSREFLHLPPPPASRAGMRAAAAAGATFLVRRRASAAADRRSTTFAAALAASAFPPSRPPPASVVGGGGPSSAKGRAARRSLSALPETPPDAPSPPPPPPRKQGERDDPPSAAGTVLPPSQEAAAVRRIMSDPSRSLYERLVRRLYMTNLFHPVKMGLQNIEALHRALGSPMDDPSIAVIHIAGTNGKGSVALKTARSLQLAGNRVGLFASPHVSSFRERMSIDGRLISEDEVGRHLPRVFGACEEHGIPATFFEVTTALAFLYFGGGGCDAVVLETGLGGRLDATNVVRSPALCVVTSIGLEHTRILGDTIEEIAREKGGIVKEGRPVLAGPNVPHEVLRACAEERGASGYYTCEDVLGGEDDEEGAGTTSSPSESGEDDDGATVDYDVENTRIATAALELLRRRTATAESEGEGGGGGGNLRLPSPEQIREGTSLRPPCRFEQVRVRPGTDGPSLAGAADDSGAVDVVLDVAHNPPAMRHLVAKLESTYPGRPKRIVAGFSSDKDLSQCGAALLSILSDDPSRLHLVEASHPRAARLEDILSASPKLRESNFDEEDRSIAAQVRCALQTAAGGDEVLVVCGSVFLMAEAREALGYDEPRDSEYVAEVAGCNLRHGQENFGNVDPEGGDGDSGAVGERRN